jgi:hypothetical protein
MRAAHQRPRTLPTPAHCVSAVLCWLVSAGLGAQTTEDPANNYHRYDNTQLQAVCDAMSPHLYVSGLTDGAWAVVPGTGRTYYYRSACYMELVRRTGRNDLCAKVVERRTLLGDGSAYSPASCEREAAQRKAAQAQQQRETAAFEKLVQGAYTLGALTATTLPNGNWLLQTTVQGTRAGAYRLEIDGSRNNRRLLTQSLTLSASQDLQWEISRADVLGNTSLPNIFPISVPLFYLVPASSERGAFEHSTGIKNVTLSAQ